MAASDTAPKGADAWLIGGIVAALLFPILGFIAAIVLFAKGRASHGVAVLLTCFLGVALGVMLVYG